MSNFMFRPPTLYFSTPPLILNPPLAREGPVVISSSGVGGVAERTFKMEFKFLIKGIWFDQQLDNLLFLCSSIRRSTQ